MRVRGALVLALVVSGCGGSSSPAAPTPTPAPSVIDLAPGLYTLTLTMSQFGEPVCDRGLCVTFGACISSGDPPARLVTTAVRVERAGDLVTIRPEDPTATFRIDLRIMGGIDVHGTAAGVFRQGSLRVSVASPDGKVQAVATGTMLPQSVAGKIEGAVSVGDYSCSNNGHTWALTRP